MIDELEDGFWRVALEEPAVNVYVLEMADGIGLINCGNAEQSPQLLAALSVLGKGPDDVRRTIATSWRPGVVEGGQVFGHADHFMLSPDLVAPFRYANWKAQQKTRLGALAPALGFGSDGPSKISHVPLQNGDVLNLGRWQFSVVSAPGPDDGHLFLHEASLDWLFVGDVALSGLPVVFDAGAYLAALDNAMALKPEVLFPNQGDPQMRGAWVLQRITRFTHNVLSHMPSALNHRPTAKEFVARDFGYLPEEPELSWEIARVQPFLEELVSAGHIGKEGEGLETRYFSKLDDPRRALRF